jgi:ribose 5-phosphate isomerase B
MKYFIASDHTGVELKTYVKNILEKLNHTVIDLGPNTNDRVDYPDFAKKVCQNIIENKNTKGILICGSGIGMSMSANKFKGIRAALCHNQYSAKMAIEHNNANILCLGQRVNAYAMIEEIILSWNNAKFQEGRHTNRIAKIDNITNK